MKRMTTKMSTVTPVTKSTGSGVANMGKKKNVKKPPVKGFASSSEMSEYELKRLPKLGMKSERTSMKSFEDMPQLMRKAVKTGTISPSMPQLMRKAVKTGTSTGMPQIARRSAKVLPEVTVTAPKPKKRLALKVTSRRMK